MSKEELLKIYSAYLPYELQVLTPIWSVDKDEKTIQTLHSLTKDDLRFKVEKDGYFNCWFEDCKPVLFSMDMLTQPIEHKGEAFVPIVELAKIGTREESCCVTNSNLGTCYVDAKNQKKGFFIYHPNGYFMWQVGKNAEPLTVWNQLELFHKLFEWHFNVFSLPDSAYIKKENLKK